MFTLIRETTVRDLLLKQAPAIVTSLVVADLFYKFHSFLLETAAFLGACPRNNVLNDIRH